MKPATFVQGFVLCVVLILAVWDFLSACLVVISGEGWWNQRKLSGWEAIHTLAPLFATQAVLEAAAFYTLYRRGAPWLASLLLAIAALVHVYAGLHVCADCRMSPGEAGEAILAGLAAMFALIPSVSRRE